MCLWGGGNRGGVGVGGTHLSAYQGVEFELTIGPQEILIHFIIGLEKYDVKKTLIFEFHIILFVPWEGLS